MKGKYTPWAYFAKYSPERKMSWVKVIDSYDIFKFTI